MRGVRRCVTTGCQNHCCRSTLSECCPWLCGNRQYHANIDLPDSDKKGDMVSFLTPKGYRTVFFFHSRRTRGVKSRGRAGGRVQFLQGFQGTAFESRMGTFRFLFLFDFQVQDRLKSYGRRQELLQKETALYCVGWPKYEELTEWRRADERLWCIRKN